MGKKYNTLKSFINISVGISISTAFFVLSWDNILGAIRENSIYGVLVILLLFVTLGWYANYLFTNITDLETYSSLEIVDKIPSLTIKEFLLVIVLSILFGILISFVTTILIYSAIATILELFDVLSDLKVMRNLSLSLKKDLFDDSKTKKKTFETIFDFWFLNPTIKRDILVLFFFFVSLVCAIIFYYTKNDIFKYLSYTIIILNICISEYIIYTWRKKRDKVIDKLEKI